MLAAVVLLPIAIRTVRRISRRSIWWMMLVGIIGNGIPAYLFTLAELKIDSGYAGILNSLTPFFALVIGLSMFQLKVKRVQLIGMVLGLAGAVGLIAQNGFVGQFNLGYSLIVVLATFCYGLSVNFIHYKLKGEKPLAIASVALVFVGVPSTIFLFTTDFLDVLQTNPGGWAGFGYIAILGIVGTAIALIIFNQLLLTTSVIISTSVTYIIPVVAVAWGVVFGEILTALHGVFGAIILAGLYLVNLPKIRERIKPDREKVTN